MRPLATVVPFGPDAARAAAGLDAVQLACDVIAGFPALKLSPAGTLAVLLAGGTDDVSLAAITEAARILKARGSQRALLFLAQPSSQVERIARLTKTFVLQPQGISQADAVRCWLEP